MDRAEPHAFSVVPAKTRMSYKQVVTIACCLALASCGQLTLENISSAPEYSGVVGATFRTKEDLWAIGVTSDKNYQKRVDYIVLVPGVGFSGPEVVTKERVTEGVLFRIVGVQKVAGFAFSRIVYVVEDVDRGRFKGVMVRVNQTGEVGDGNLGLNQSSYEAIAPSQPIDKK